MKNNTAIVCLSPNSGGMEIDSIKLAKKLSLYSQIVLVAKKDKFIEKQSGDYLGFNGINLETINFKTTISFSIIFRMREIVKQYNIKNVIFFGASELKSLYFSFLGLDINLIVRHGTTKSRPKKDWFHRLIYSNVNYHVSISKHLQNNVKYIIPFSTITKEVLIYPSFDFFKSNHTPQKKITLLHIGRIAKGKGQVDAIKACQILIDHNIDFVLNIVGGLENSYKEEFEIYYNKCKYKDKIKLLGFTNNIDKYLNSSDIFIFPSYGEGFGNSFLEAISSNLVCLTYKNTTFPEFEDLGLYFTMTKNKDIEQLKSNLLNIVENLVNEKEKSSVNSEICQNIFSIKNEINSYINILK